MNKRRRGTRKERIQQREKDKENVSQGQVEEWRKKERKKRLEKTEK